MPPHESAGCRPWQAVGHGGRLCIHLAHIFGLSVPRTVEYREGAGYSGKHKRKHEGLEREHNVLTREHRGLHGPTDSGV